VEEGAAVAEGSEEAGAAAGELAHAASTNAALAAAKPLLRLFIALLTSRSR
jgi:hypothetical protein